MKIVDEEAPGKDPGRYLVSHSVDGDTHKIRPLWEWGLPYPWTTRWWQWFGNPPSHTMNPSDITNWGQSPAWAWWRPNWGQLPAHTIVQSWVQWRVNWQSPTFARSWPWWRPNLGDLTCPWEVTQKTEGMDLVIRTRIKNLAMQHSPGPQSDTKPLCLPNRRLSQSQGQRYVIIVYLIQTYNLLLQRH